MVVIQEVWQQLWAENAPFMEAFRRAECQSQARVRLDIEPATREDVAAVSSFLQSSSRQGMTGPGLRHEEIEAAARRCLWSRFLHLERSLLSALRRSDWLLAAGLTRCAAEELERIDRVLLSASTTDDPMRAIATAAFHSDSPTRNASDAGQRLAPLSWRGSIAARVNGYVHPNYGGHLAVIRPETATAATALLDALADLYEHLTGMATATRVVRPATASDMPDELGATLHADDLHVLLLRLETEGDAFAFLGEHAARTREELRRRRLECDKPSEPGAFDEECATVAHAIVASSDWQTLPTERPELGLPQHPFAWRYGLPIARSIWARLNAAAATLPHPTDEPQSTLDPAYFGYLHLLAQAAIAVAQVKCTAYAQSLTKALALSDGPSIVLAARGMIEHYAASLFAAQRFGETHEQLAKAGSNAAEVARRASRLEQSLARFVGAGGGPRHEGGAFSERCEILRLTIPTGIGDVVREAFSDSIDEELIVAWERLSRLVHGREAPMPALVSTHSPNVLGLAALVLAELESTDYQLRLVAKFMDVLPAIETLGDAAPGKTNDVKKMMTSVHQQQDKTPPAYLREDRHFSGEGTRENPYRLLFDKSYYHAYDVFLEHLGAGEATRRVVHSPHGLLDEVTCEDGRVVFLHPQRPAASKGDD